LFFVLHEFTRNYYAVPVPGSLLLILAYSLASFVIALVCLLAYRHTIKSALLAFAFISFQLFFGNVQDTLKSVPFSFVSQYRFILPFSLLLLGFIAFALKKTRKNLSTLTYYLNLLFLLLIVIDTGWLIKKTTRENNYETINKIVSNKTIPDSCHKPDIYLLLMDQYAGNSALNKIYHFDNSYFLNELKSRGFYIADKSRSNYNLTPFSMASALSMNYLDSGMSLPTKLNLGYCYQAIRNSSVLKFLNENGYTFYNYSVFDFPGQPAHKYEAFLPYGTALITLNTFTGRILRDITNSIRTGKLGFVAERRNLAYENLKYNDSTFTLTNQVASERTSFPKFVYSHFMLPHFPYYFNKDGEQLPIDKLTDFKRTNSNDYIEYLQYGNKKILSLIDNILSHSSNPPVILLLSDHGSRRLNKGEENTNDFVNLNAVYIPGKKYTLFYDSITNVNQFRVLFNTCFAQQLPLLKDSVCDVKIY
jgi:hypothetical protein